MLGNTVQMALEKMKQTNQSQHSDGLLQVFYAMAQRNGEPIGKYTVRLGLATGKVWLQSCKALGSTEANRSRLLVDCLLQSMNPKLQARVAHAIDGKDSYDRPSYYKLVKFAIQKEAEINFDEAKKMRDLNLKPQATTHFHYKCRKSTLPTTPAVHMVTPAPEEEDGKEDITPQPNKDSDRGESYEASLEDSRVSAGDIEVAIQVVCTAETFSSWCFRCNKVGH